MPSPFIGSRISKELHKALQEHIKESGEKLPRIIEKALSSYLGYASPSSESHDELEERVASLESSLRELREMLEKMQQAAPPIENKAEDIAPPGQLSFLDTDIKIDSNADISQETDADIKPANVSHINQETDPDEKLETLTPQQMAERLGMTIGTLKNYMSTKRKIKRDGFLYRPVSGKRKGESVWVVERTK